MNYRNRHCFWLCETGWSIINWSSKKVIRILVTLSNTVQKQAKVPTFESCVWNLWWKKFLDHCQCLSSRGSNNTVGESTRCCHYSWVRGRGALKQNQKGAIEVAASADPHVALETHDQTPPLAPILLLLVPCSFNQTMSACKASRVATCLT